ncbi:MAG: putative Ig domain-containing protein [Opitutae bacterium]|nr:putative Ig domain-containing protein [Opitutae bacterium]
MQFHRNDIETLRVDATGMVYYVCKGLTAVPEPAAEPHEAKPLIDGSWAPGSSASVAEPITVPIANPPAYSSRPGAANVLYLDFNGHVLTGSAWNSSANVSSWNFLAYDLDGDSATFSEAEQSAIYQIWQRVAEDFAPFNINVTTVEPTTFGPRTGRVLITRNTDANGVAAPYSTAGGVAYVGVFNYSSYVTTYQPALVYYNNLAGGRPDIVSEAASHEFGHNLGLSHDGTSSLTYYGGHGSGAVSWGPIMGTGYNQAVSQWSKGEYYGANNTEDDLAIMANLLTYRADDVGNTPATATTVVPQGNAISLSGLIEQSTDVDYFRLTLGGGTVSVTASPFRSAQYTNGGNLDIRLRLLDANGTVLATANPTDETRATLTATVTGGTFFLEVAPVGVGTPLSNPPSGYTVYGSIGQYTVTGTIPTTPAISSSLNAYGYLGTAFNYAIVAPGATTYNATGLPPGLSVNLDSGRISGTPTATGTFGVTIAAANSYGTDTRILTLNVTPAAPPAISSALTANANANATFSYAITATNNPSTFNAVGLPSGLTVNVDTGVISGTPIATGTYHVTIAAANIFGRDARTLTLTVAPHPSQPAITSSLTATALAGASFSYAITATNSPTAYNATGLPAGLAINQTSGLISGAPTASGTFGVTIAAANTFGTDTRTLVLSVGLPPIPLISSPLSASSQAGSFFSYTITASNSPTAFNATGLPAALSVNQTTGVISGTPTTAGTFDISIAAANYGGRDSRTLSLTVSPQPAPVIFSATAASAQVGVAFSYTIQATNSPTSFNALGLPPGLTINTSSGSITGTPTTPGTFGVTIAAANYGGRDSRTLTLNVVPAPPPVITSSLTSSATTGASYRYAITATNQPNSFNAIGLPSGLVVDTSTGVISGIPISVGSFNVEIAAANSTATDRKTLALTVAAGPPPNDNLANAVSLGSSRSGNIVGSNLHATRESAESTLPNAAGRTVWYSWFAPTNGATPISRMTFAVSGLDAVLAVYTGSAASGPYYLTEVGINDDDPAGGTTDSLLNFNAVAGNTYYILVDGADTRAGPFNLSWSDVATRAPTITNQSAVYLPAGISANYPIVALYSATDYAATGLPPGLTINSASGGIAGTPTTPGTFNVQLRAGNTIGWDTRAVSFVIYDTTVVPPNDNFANAQAINGGFGSLVANNARATAESGEPVHWSGNSHSIWYRWLAPSTGTALLTTKGSSFDTTLAVYTGTALSSLTIVARNDDSNTDTTSRLTFAATAGVTYYVAVDSYSSGSYGPVQLNWSGLAAMPPVIDSALTASITRDAPFSYSITAKNTPNSYNALGLPPGLSVDTVTGVISGTPTAIGAFGVSIAAANNYGRDARTLVITVVRPAPVITSALTASAQVDLPFRYAIDATNSPNAFNALGLPPGLTVDTSTGVVSGTPSASGAFAIAIAAANTTGRDSRILTLTVAPAVPPVITNGATATGYLRFPFELAIAATNGPTSFSASGLPAGLVVDPATGAISGAPTVMGTFVVQLRAANSAGSAMRDITMTVARAPQDSLLSGSQTDLLLENRVSGARVIWRMSGTSIVGSANLPTFTSGWHFAGVGDFNADGRADIVLQNTLSGEHVIWLMSGATIVSSVALPTLPTVWQIACVGDADADDQPDIFLQNSATGERVVWKMAGTAIQSSLALPALPTMWLIGGATDFSGDGRADIVLQNTESGERVLWIMNADFAIAQSVTLPAGYDGWRIAGVGHLTSDGRPNILLQNALSGERRLWSLASDYTVAATVTLPTLPAEWSFAGPAINAARGPIAKDLDRDGFPDILFSNPTERSRWLASLRDLEFHTVFELPGTAAEWRVSHGGDLNGDGYNDLLFENTGTGARGIWLMRGPTLVSALNLPTLAPGWRFESTTDLNHDRRTDILLRNINDGQQVVWILDGWRVHASVPLPTLSADWHVVGSGTFSVDGLAQFVLENSSTGEHVIWSVNPDGSVARSSPLPTLDRSWHIVAVADYDQDGNSDLLVHNPQAGHLIIWRMNGASISRSVQLPSVYAPSQIDG